MPVADDEGVGYPAGDGYAAAGEKALTDDDESGVDASDGGVGRNDMGGSVGTMSPLGWPDLSRFRIVSMLNESV